MVGPISQFRNFELETVFNEHSVEHTYYTGLGAQRRPSSRVRWRELRQIGAGAFGTVWLEQRDGGQLRAVKRVPRRIALEARFTHELMALITLADHHHLFVRFRGWYESQHEVFISMEYVRHGDLGEYVKSGPKARSDAMEITKQILQGLEVLHSERICHRDIKPQNILIASLDPIWVKIADFGTSKRSTDTALRTRCGTAAYVAPEITRILPTALCTGEEFSDAVDIWSLGCLVHQLLAAQLPFQERPAPHDDAMTGLDTAVSGLLPEVDMQALYNYCQGHIAFPEQPLRDAGATAEQMGLVKSLLRADPRSRATAAGALRDPAVALNRYRSGWCTRLQLECSDMGLALDLGSLDESVLRRAHAVDLTSCLRPPPSDAALRALLDQAYRRGHFAAAWMLLNVRRQSLSAARKVFEQAFDDRRGDWIELLATHRKVKIDGPRIDLRTALGTAVYNGWIDVAQSLLRSGADANIPVGRGLLGEKPLVVAARQRDIAMAKLLLDRAALVNGTDADRGMWTALQRAVEIGHVDMVRLLLDNGADINAPPAENSGRTALQMAAANGNTELVILLLHRGAEIDAPAGQNWGRTALQAAAEKGEIETVRLLFDNQADINADAGPCDGRTAIEAAAEGGHLEVVQFLLDEKAHIDDSAHDPLQAAAGGGHIEVVQLLMTPNDRHAPGSQVLQHNGYAAMRKAARGGYLEMVTMLLEHVDINAKILDDAAATVFQAAAEGGHIDVVRLLLDNKADIHAKPVEAHGLTALQAAAGGGHVDLVKLLLDSDADLNAGPAKSYGRTALQAAAEGGHISVVKLLLDNNAKINAKPCDEGGRTALQAAAQHGHTDIVKLLLVNKANPNGSPSKREGRTALQAAAASGHIDIVKLLIAHQADVNAAAGDEFGGTALQLAIEEKHPAVIGLLKSNGAVNQNLEPPTIIEQLGVGPTMLRILVGLALLFVLMVLIFSYSVISSASSMPVMLLIPSVFFVFLLWAIVFSFTYMLLV